RTDDAAADYASGTGRTLRPAARNGDEGAGYISGARAGGIASRQDCAARCGRATGTVRRATKGAPSMSEFIVVDYHDTLRAGRVLELLRRRYPEWKGDLEDALVFVMHAREQAFSAGWWKEQVRLSDDFLFQARRLIRPGDSAMALLVKDADL